MSQFNWSEFNAEEVETPSREPLPAGWYNVAITESAMEPNAAQTGEFLKLTMVVTDGEHEGRYLFTRLNLVHPNQKAVAIARAELAKICKAVGVVQPKDSSDLHAKVFAARVVIKPDQQGNPQNEIKDFAAANHGGAQAAPPPARTTAAPAASEQEAPPAAQQTAPATTKPAATAGTKKTPPWRK